MLDEVMDEDVLLVAGFVEGQPPNLDMPIDEASDGVLVVWVIVHIGDRELFLREGGDVCLHLQLVQGIKVNILRRPQIQQILLQLIVVPFIPL